ncbi:MAG: hypothetical protein U5K36_13015 [Roseovarius sp.]|nr:hypothetical protein [Roseovarius sp.]
MSSPASDAEVVNDFELIDRFRQPVHVGRVLVEELVLSNMSAATLNQLDALNGLDLERDVQVVLPRADIANEIGQFFRIQNLAVRRVSRYFGRPRFGRHPTGLRQSFLSKSVAAIAVIDFDLKCLPQ